MMRKIEFHYYKDAGHGSQLCCYRDGELQKANSWSEFNDLIGEFIQLREKGDIELLRTEESDHPLLYGHHGKVNIYGTLQ